MRLNFHLYSYIFLSGLFIFSCGDAKKESKAEDVVFSSDEKKLAAEIDQLLNDLPSPSEVPYTLQAAAADYNESLINGVSKISTYQNDIDKSSLNLGIYATDIGYLASYEKVQQTLDYIESCEKLAETIGIANVFDAQLIKSFQGNLENPDSLSSIMDFAVKDAGKNLQASERLDDGALILYGSFIEGLYLTVMVIETYPKDILDETNRNIILEPLVRIVLNQKKALFDVINLLKQLPEGEANPKVMSDLNKLKGLYEGELAEIDKKISENTGNFILTQEMLSPITAEVKRIRGEIVE